jgi:hypothetical protein
MLLWAWTGSMVLRDRRDILVAVTLWALSAAVGGFAAIAQVAGVNGIAGPLEGNRALGFTDHPNDLGGAAAVAAVPCLMLAARLTNASPVTVLARWVLLALIAAGLLLSGSVAAMVAALVAGVIWLSSPSVRGLGRVAVVAGLAIAVLVSSVAGKEITSPTERLAQVTARPGSGPDNGSGGTRLRIVEAVWPHIVDDPFVGAGLGHSDLAVQIISGGISQTEQVHGAPLAAWYEGGIFALIGMLLIFGAFTGAGWRASAAAEDIDDRLIGWSLVAGFTAFVVYALSAPLYFQQYGWLAAVMLLAWRSALPASAAPEQRR